MDNIVYRLCSYVDATVSEDTNYHIAKTILKNLNKIHNIYEVAEICSVSPATISRFCRFMGYNSFNAFKKTFSGLDKTVEEVFYNTEEQRDNYYSKPENAFRSLCHSISINLEKTMESLNYELIDRIIHRIHNANKVGLYSRIPNITMKIQYEMVLAGKLMIAYTDDKEQLDSIRKLNENSYAIIVSVHGNYNSCSNEIVREIVERKVPCLLITANPRSPLIDLYDDLLVVGDENSLEGNIYAVECVCKFIVNRYYSLFCKEFCFQPSLEK